MQSQDTVIFKAMMLAVALLVVTHWLAFQYGQAVQREVVEEELRSIERDLRILKHQIEQRKIDESIEFHSRRGYVVWNLPCGV